MRDYEEYKKLYGGFENFPEYRVEYGMFHSHEIVKAPNKSYVRMTMRGQLNPGVTIHSITLYSGVEKKLPRVPKSKGENK